MMTNTAIADKAYLLWGIAKKEQHDTAQAMQLFEKSLVLNPSNTDAVLQVAGLLYHKDKNLALKYLDRALAMDEFNYEALYAKGLIYQEQGRYDLALKHYDEVRRLRPGHLLAYNNAIVIYFLNSQWQKASELAEKYVQLAPRNANAMAMKGFALENLGNKKAALIYYEAALKIDPGNPYANNGKKALAP
jgi:tetratricopeptide (TPR) repeat protein